MRLSRAGAAAAQPAHGKTPVLQSLQAGRGIAALLVVFTHSTFTASRANFFGIPWFDHAFNFSGVLAVCYFFVLSGFIIAHAHATDVGQPTALRRYLTRRFERVYPLYWVVFLGASAAALAVAPLRSILPTDLFTWLAALTLIPLDPAKVGGSGAPVLVVAWTLQYEIVFYTLFALAIISRYLFAASVVLVIGARLACSDGCSFPVQVLARDYILMFFAGIAISWLVGRRMSPVIGPRGGLACVIAGFALAAIATLLGARMGFTPLPAGRELLYGAASALVIFGSVCAERGGIALGSNRFMQLIGAASYSIYLVHFPTLSLVGKVVRKLQGETESMVAAWLCVAAMFTASAAVGVIVHLTIEAPIARRLAARRTRLPAPVVANRNLTSQA